ncbi:MAG TPA: transcriptional repressor LexA [Candidatus Polarisedimenticolia bacterium]|nr:transcriptional repressor LexA [Candidatus Polarisedimenticolia bacterium]
MVLTKKQKMILDFITRFLDEKGYSPSLMEIGEHFGLRSVATVHKHVDNLRKKGLVRKTWNANRSLELTPAALGIRAIRLPLAGRVAAGQPIEAVEQREVIAVPEDMVGRGESFVLQVRGDSMIDEQIRDGDYVVVERRGRVHDGDVVVALLDGQEATLKRYRKQGESVCLEPANPRMEPIVVPAERVRIQGVVTGLLRRYA